MSKHHLLGAKMFFLSFLFSLPSSSIMFANASLWIKEQWSPYSTLNCLEFRLRCLRRIAITLAVTWQMVATTGSTIARGNRCAMYQVVFIGWTIRVGFLVEKAVKSLLNHTNPALYFNFKTKIVFNMGTTRNFTALQQQSDGNGSNGSKYTTITTAATDRPMLMLSPHNPSRSKSWKFRKVSWKTENSQVNCLIKSRVCFER